MFKNWKNKIADHEETPPESVWDSIANKLDEEDAANEPGFVSRLNKFEQAPPANIWDNIAAQLDNENVVGSKIPDRKLVSIYRKLAVAATVLIIVSLVFFLSNKKTSHESESISKNIAPSKTEVTPTNSQSADTNSIVNKKPVKNDVAIIKKKVRTNPIRPSENIKFESIAYTKQEIVPLANDAFADNHDKIRNEDGTFSIDADKMDAPNTYIMASLGPNGESIRVSSKLKDYINYLSDRSIETEEYLDKIIKGSAEWKARIKQWSKKLIDNNISPSFNNFFDVFELSNLLEQNK